VLSVPQGSTTRLSLIASWHLCRFGLGEAALQARVGQCSIWPCLAALQLQQRAVVRVFWRDNGVDEPRRVTAGAAPSGRAPRSEERLDQQNSGLGTSRAARSSALEAAAAKALEGPSCRHIIVVIVCPHRFTRQAHPPHHGQRRLESRFDRSSGPSSSHREQVSACVGQEAFGAGNRATRQRPGIQRQHPGARRLCQGTDAGAGTRTSSCAHISLPPPLPTAPPAGRRVLKVSSPPTAFLIATAAASPPAMARAFSAVAAVLGVLAFAAGPAAGSTGGPGGAIVVWSAAWSWGGRAAGGPPA
jgi:hypothetical protein